MPGKARIDAPRALHRPKYETKSKCHGRPCRPTYDADNRITTMTNGSISFDANGSVITKTEGTKSFTYVWDYDNQLQGWTDGSQNVDYQYDGLGNRMASVRGGAETRYVLDIGSSLPNVLAETDAGGNITARYIYGLGLIARVDTEGTHYYHYDPLGSTIAMSDESGEMTDEYAYHPFGALANRGGNTENLFTFVGKYGLMDEGNGLYYVRARYYDSHVGRFLKKDVITGDDVDPRTLHRYAYARNNPVSVVDVSGLCGEDDPLDKWWYQATDWVDPLVSSVKGGYHKAKDFGGLFTEPYGWKTAGKAWAKVGDAYVDLASSFVGSTGWRAAGQQWKDVVSGMTAIFDPEERNTGQQALVDMGAAMAHFSAGVVLEFFAGGTAATGGAMWHVNPKIGLKSGGLALEGMSQFNEASVDFSLALENAVRYLNNREAKLSMSSKEGLFGFMVFLFDINTALNVGNAGR
mgnify:CR=1 FL=1